METKKYNKNDNQGFDERHKEMNKSSSWWFGPTPDSFFGNGGEIENYLDWLARITNGRF